MLATFKPGCRILTYNRLEDIYTEPIMFPWRRLSRPYGVRPTVTHHSQRVRPTRISQPQLSLTQSAAKVLCIVQDDHYAASWGNARFYVYQKVL